MITLSNPEYLLLIFLIPVMFIAFWWMRRIRKKRIVRFGDSDLVQRLTPTASKRKGWVKLMFLSLALFFFAIGMAGPQIGATLKKREVKGAEIMIVLDVSNSMLAQDYSPNRIERAKLAISKLVDELSEDRIGLIIFAGQSFVQLPVTSDYVSAKIFLNTIDTQSVPVQGTAVGEAIRTAIRSFTMDSENSRAIILITDGENHEDDPVSAAKDAAAMGARVFCIGVGSPEGKPIPMADGLLKDKNGDIVVTRLDEKILREVAQAGNGMYVRAGNTEFGLNPIIEEIRNLEAKEFQSVVFEEYDQQYMYFFGIALIFLLIELMISPTRNGRSLFGGTEGGSSSAAGKGLAVIALCLMMSLPAAAQTDRKEVREGNRLFEKGNYTEAEVEYKRALEADTASVFAKYNLGNALYKNESYSEAELYLKNIGDSLRSISSEKASDFYHNVGNLALKNKKYQEAVDAFKESLRLLPTNYETKSNLAYAQKMLENQQNQQQQQQDQNQDQNQDQQDQNQQNQQQDQNQQNQQNQDQQQDKQDQNKDQQNQNQNQQQQQPQQQEAKITPQAAEQLLQAIADKEKETQEKVKKAEAEEQKKKQKDKNW